MENTWIWIQMPNKHGMLAFKADLGCTPTHDSSDHYDFSYF